MVVSGRYGGFRAGLVTTLLGGILADYLFIEPRSAFRVEQAQDMASLVVFLLMGTLISWIAHERHVALARLSDAHDRERQARLLAQETAERLERSRGEAEAANQAKDEFLAMLGHELRNPLAPIVTALELIRQKSGGQLGRLEQVIARQVHHLCRMVDDLLDASRVARGMITLTKKTVEFAPVIARSIEMASPLLESRRHELHIDVPPNLLVDADPDRLAQVFANVLTNAAKYTDPGGRIAISAKREAAEVVVCVSDNGVGMSPELLRRVFDLFVQGRQSMDRSAGGLGIGLSLVKSLVTLHGGAVSAHSEGLQRGSTIEVRLPVSTQREKAPSASDESEQEKLTVSRRVLLVDDNEDAANSLAEALRAKGYIVDVAFDGVQALSVVESAQPDVAVLDIGLPVMDGYELAARLRERLAERSPRMIAVTGYGQESDRASTRAAGFERHLVKPVRLPELFAIIGSSAPPADADEAPHSASAQEKPAISLSRA